MRNSECGMRNCSEGSLASRPPLYIPHSEFRIPHLVDWAFRISYPRPRPSSYESLKHASRPHRPQFLRRRSRHTRSEEHTSELQSPCNLVCRLLLEKKN